MTALNRDHPARREALAVADAIDLVEDRHPRIAGAQEIGVQGVHQAIGGDRAPGRDERLTRDLATEDADPALLRASAPEDVHVEFLEVEDLDQLVDQFLHRLHLGLRKRTSDPRSPGSRRPTDS